MREEGGPGLITGAKRCGPGSAVPSGDLGAGTGCAGLPLELRAKQEAGNTFIAAKALANRKRLVRQNASQEFGIAQSSG